MHLIKLSEDRLIIETERNYILGANDNYNHNKEYKTVLKVGDELAFGENNPGQEAINFIERVISFILTFFIARR